MQQQRTRYGYALTLEEGEEIVDGLTRFAAGESVRAAAISGLGAVGEAELGFFDHASRTYVRRTFTGGFEIGALVGNFSELDGRPFPHCHLTIAGGDFVAHTGHLFRAVVSVACEIQVISDPGVLRRQRRDDLGFHPLALGPDRPAVRA